MRHICGGPDCDCWAVDEDDEREPDEGDTEAAGDNYMQEREHEHGMWAGDFPDGTP